MKKHVVTKIYFQSTVFIHGIGDIGNSLPNGTRTIPGLSMHTEPEGVFVHDKTSGAKALVPWGNIKNATLGAEVEDGRVTSPTPLKSA